MKSKKIFVFLAGLFAISMVSVRAKAASGDAGNIHWDYTDGVLTIGKIDSTGSGDIPYYSFPSQPWYPYSYSATSIVIERGITSIGEGALYLPHQAESITIPDTVTSIGNNAFISPSKVTSLTIPDSVTSIGSSAFNFQNGSALTSLTIGDGVKEIGSMTFAGASKLTELKIGESVTSIGQYAFRDATSLKNLTIPDSVTTIGPYAFQSTTNLENVVIGDSVTEIGSGAFASWSSPNKLKNVVIGDSVTSIGSSAFGYYTEDAKIFCQNTTENRCKNLLQKSVSSFIPNLVEYTKDANGVYTYDGLNFASADDMVAGTSCGTVEACQAKIAENREAKALQMAQNGVLCQTKTGCLKLLDMVANGDLVCEAGSANSISNCSAYAKSYNIALNDPDTATSTTGGSSGTYAKKRIYTVEEAERVSKPTGNRIMLRYK